MGSSTVDTQARLVVRHHGTRLGSLERDVRLLLAEHAERVQAEENETRKHQRGSRLALLTTLLLFSLSLTTAVVYRRSEDGSKIAAEFIAYALPALAALVAGLTAFLKKREIRWFWISTLLVLSGVVVFMGLEGVSSILLWDLLIAYGVTTTTCVPLAIAVRAIHTKTWPRGRSMLVAVLGAAFAAAGLYEASRYHDHPSHYFVEVVHGWGITDAHTLRPVQCTRLSEDVTHHTEVLRCPTTDPNQGEHQSH